MTCKMCNVPYIGLFWRQEILADNNAFIATRSVKMVIEY